MAELKLVIRKYRYIVFNKPYEVLTQFTPELAGQRTLAEFGLPKDVYAAGRLDYDSEGLLLLTDDGRMIQTMLEPGRGHARAYHVQVEGAIDDAALIALARGVDISGYRTLPAKATLLGSVHYQDRVPPIRKRLSIPTSWIELTLLEGKNRQVRKMTAAVGFPTLRLIRSAIGSLTLGSLKSGEWRELTPSEVDAMKKRPA